MYTFKASHHKHVISLTESLKALFYLLHFSTSTCTTCQHHSHTITNIASYADDITITTTHPDADRACTLQQEYLDFLKAWVDENRLKIAPAKSTTTLLTSHRHQHDFIPNVTLNNIQIPHPPTTKILGVT